MTLKEIYISECENKIKNNELYIPGFFVSNENELLKCCENISFIYNDFDLIHGNIALSKISAPKREKRKISLSDNNFVNILKSKIPACKCRIEKEITFRKAIQTAWFYLFTDTVFAFLNIDFSNLENKLEEYLLNDIRNARTTDTEVIHLMTDFLCKYKLYKTAEEKCFSNPSPYIEFFCGNGLLAELKKQI